MGHTNVETAICGLYCGTCPSFGEECDGCLSDRVAPRCQTCRHGFRSCADDHAVRRCYECAQFPCERLKAFSKQHVVNGICHHAHVIRDLGDMKRLGVAEWIRRQKKANTCLVCGNLIPWCEKSCPRCGAGREMRTK